MCPPACEPGGMETGYSGDANAACPTKQDATGARLVPLLASLYWACSLVKDSCMTQLLAALIGLFGALVGILIGAWRQAELQRSESRYEDLRRWQQERREAYLQIIVADDELYRGLVRDIRDPPPGRATDDPVVLGFAGVLLPPLSSEQRLDVLNIFDRVWRAKRTIELFHLVNDDLLAGQSLGVVSAKASYGK